MQALRSIQGNNQLMSSMQGMTMPQRLLSKSRPEAVFARAILISMILLLIMFIVYKLVTIVTTDEGKLLRGKLVILSLALILGTASAALARPILTSIYKPLEALVD
jgi:hypothetical protein